MNLLFYGSSSKFSITLSSPCSIEAANEISLLIKKDEEGNPGKIFKIHDKKLKGQNNLMLFYIQTDTCSACSVVISHITDTAPFSHERHQSLQSPFSLAFPVCHS